MNIYFSSITMDPKKYLTEKLGTGFSTDQKSDLSHEVESAMSHLSGTKPTVAREEDFIEISDEQKKIIEVSKRCALQELADSSPLIEGEVIEEDFFSYLSEPWHDFPADTAVLRRTTNFAQLLYIFDLVKIEHGKVIHLMPLQPAEETRVLKGIEFEITGALVKKLLQTAGKKAAEKALGMLGSFVINIVMKEVFGVDDTQKLLDEIKKIIKDEIESNEITKIQGTIDGTLLFLTTEYKHRKDKADLSSPEARRALLNSLTYYSNKFYTDVIGTLKQEKYAVRGLKTFAMGATVHLIITQEMALIDPDYMNPNDSGYLLTLRDNAVTYRSHVESHYNKAMGERNNMGIFYKDFTDCQGNICVHKTMTMWRDNVTGEVVGEFFGSKKPKKTALENATASLERHRNAVLSELDAKLGKPKENFLAEIGGFEKYTFPKPANSALSNAS